jgi:hypothetical protein
LPTGLDLVEQYLEPLAALPPIRYAVRLGTRVAAVSLQFVDNVKTPRRDAMPFVVRTIDADGVERDELASGHLCIGDVVSGRTQWARMTSPARGEASHEARKKRGRARR